MEDFHFYTLNRADLTLAICRIVGVRVEAEGPAMNRKQRMDALTKEMGKRILVLDGSMGAYLQGFDLNSNDFHGERFVEHPRALKGDNDLLVLTRPDVVMQVHEGYLAAGADIIETNTFNATAISQAEYGLEEIARELNYEAATPCLRGAR